VTRAQQGASEEDADGATVSRLEISKLFGLPAHPLLVHLPIVLIPLAALGALALVAVPRWRKPFGPLVVGIAAVALVGVQLALGSGEALERHVEKSAILRRHTELADSMRPLMFLFFVLLLAFVLIDRKRPTWARQSVVVTIAVATVLSGGLTTARLAQVGHNGARATWHDTDMTKKTRRAGNDD
jgi:xanthine/uracil permease